MEILASGSLFVELLKPPLSQVHIVHCIAWGRSFRMAIPGRRLGGWVKALVSAFPQALSRSNS